MKMTIDLPESLIRQLKLRAVRNGKKLKELTADLLRDGLRQPQTEETRATARIVKSKLSGFPMLEAQGKATSPLSPDDVAQALINEEATWAIENMRRHDSR